MTARAGNENDVRKVTAVLTEQQYAWAQEVVLSGAMEGLTCSVSTVIRLALEELRERTGKRAFEDVFLRLIGEDEEE